MKENNIAIIKILLETNTKNSSPNTLPLNFLQFQQLF